MKTAKLGEFVMVFVTIYFETRVSQTRVSQITVQIRITTEIE